MDPFTLGLVFLGLLLILAFFAGTEFPLLSISEHKIQAFLKQKRFGAKALFRLRKKGEALLVTNLIGTTLATVGASSVATFLAISISERLPYDHEHTIVFIELLSSASILFFGEIGPKILGITVPDTIGLAVAPIYRSIFAFFRPISLGVEYFVKIISLITGTKIEMHGKKVSEEEFDAFIDMSHEGGAVEADERRQIKNLLSLSDMTAEAVLTPRVNVEFLSLDMTIDEACTFFMESSHSRIPVYGETTDDIDYVITFREAFKLQREGFGKAQLGSLTLEKIMKVPGTQPLDDLFEKFQKSRRHIALVVDEHGGTAGIVTMEDVLEEVFGDIKDEHDKEEIYIRKTGPRKIEAIGMVLIEDVLEEWNISPDDIYLPEEYQNESLAYIIMAEKGDFTAVGTSVVLGKKDEIHITLTVLSVFENVIERVECQRS